MQVIGLEVVDLNKFRFSDAFDEKLKDPLTATLAQSYDDVGPIHEPIVRIVNKRFEVISGEHRIAGHVLSKHKTVTCKVVECSDIEAERIRAAENAHRDHNPAKQKEHLDELVALLAKKAVAKNPKLRLGGRGRGKTALRAAREQVAAERGITVESVRIQEHRQKKRKAAAAAGLSVRELEEKERADKEAGIVTPALEEGALPPVKTLDMELDRDFALRMVGLQGFIDRSTASLRTGNMILTKLLQEGYPVREEELERAQEQLSAATRFIASLRPWTLCPACKGLTQVQNECATCRMSGYLTKDEESRVPEELTQTHPLVVLYRGKFVPVEDFSPAPAEDFAAPVEDVFGGLE